MNQDDFSLVRENLVEWARYWGAKDTDSDDAVQAIGRIKAAFDSAFQVGRESVLKAAEELAKSGQSTVKEPGLDPVTRQQSADTLKALGDWCEQDPEHNRYDCGLSGLLNPLKRWRVTMWHQSPFDDEGNPAANFVNRHTCLYGSSHADAMAKGAQWCLLEIATPRGAK